MAILPKDTKKLEVMDVDFLQALQQETRKVVVKKEEAPLVLPDEPAAHKIEGALCQLDLHPKPLFCC